MIRAVGFALLCVLVVIGCQPPQSGPSPSSCPIAEGDGLVEGDVSGLTAGTFRLVLSVTEPTTLLDSDSVVGLGPVKTGAKTRKRVVEGELWLAQQDSVLRYLRTAAGERDTTAEMPLYGATDLDFAAVGAVDTGDPMSREPNRPGVAVLVQRIASSDEGSLDTRITLRIGAKANRRGVTLFDGGYTALRVSRIGTLGFAGTWSSGAMSIESQGRFCAVRSAS